MKKLVKKSVMANKKTVDAAFKDAVKQTKKEFSRHETLVENSIFKRYEEICKANKISARSMTAAIIEEFVSDDGHVSLANWRNKRLCKLFNEAEKLSVGIMEYVGSVRDHKGILEVCWKDTPSIHDMCILESAWIISIGESEVNHFDSNGEELESWISFKSYREKTTVTNFPLSMN